MKKFIAIIMALTLILSLSAQCFAADKPITLVMGGTNTEENVLTKADRYFINLVEEKTDGRLKIDYYPNNVLGGDRALVDSILVGSVDIAQCGSANFSQYSNALDFLELPGLFQGTEHYYKVLADESIMGPVKEKIEADCGLTILRATTMGGEPRCMLYTGDEIRVPADCVGKVYRTTGSAVEVALFKELGITPQVVEYSETYTAMQQHMVEGVYITGNNGIEGLFTEVSDNVTFCNLSWVTHLLVASATLKDKIGEELYGILCDCIDESVTYATELWAADVENTHKVLGEKINAVALTDEEQQEWYDAAAKIWDQFIGVSVTQEQIDAIAALK